MYNRLERIYCRLAATVKQTPLEIGVAALYWLLGVLDVLKVIGIKDFIWTFPICFCVIYGMNQFTLGRKNRWMYYVSGLTVAGFAVWNLQLDDMAYWVSLILSQLWVIYGRREFENDTFVGNGVNYLCDMACALCLGVVCMLLSMAIYHSCTYIFDISTLNTKSYIYISLTSYLIATPVFFLAFNVKRVAEPAINQFFSFLVNFILSPALLIYIAILYLYFVKILVIWSLPKGGVAYMVTTFIILVFLVRAVQPMLKKRYYDWFYNYFSWWVLPALMMLWVGVSYRVWEYGLTEKRCYLLLTTVTLTFAVVMSFRREKVSYAVLGGISGVLLALFTYIPGISAKDIGVASQMHYLKQMTSALGMVDSTGWLVKQTEGRVDSLSADSYQRLYESFKFLEEEKGGRYMYERFGVSTSWGLKDSIFSHGQRDLLSGGSGGKWDSRIDLYRNDILRDGMDIRRFSMVESVVGEEKIGGVYYSYSDDGVLIVNRNEEVIVKMNLNEWFATRLAAEGLGVETPYTQEELEAKSASFMVCDVGKIRLVFTWLVVNPINNKIEEVNLSFMLSE